MPTMRGMPRRMVFDNLHTLLGAVLLTGEPVISDDGTDQRSTGVPPGHPPAESYLGLPIHAAGAFVAMVGLANPPGRLLAGRCAISATVAQHGGASGAGGPARRAAKSESQLARTSALLAEKPVRWKARWPAFPRASPAWMPPGHIRVYNRRYLELLDLPEELLATQPTVEEVVRFQTGRGDSGPGFELIEPSPLYGRIGIGSLVARRWPSARNLYPPRGAVSGGAHAVSGGRGPRAHPDVTEYLGTLQALREARRWRGLYPSFIGLVLGAGCRLPVVRFDGSAERDRDIPDESQYG